ncbi:MAG: hypothetical protein RM338_05600 [Nostoc sp. DedQUE12a]|nr:hypothetical protein [Nostoc sp. DedQUE12a]
MNGKWYSFIWRELVRTKLYVAIAHNSVDEAILKIFETSGHSPNEYSKEFEAIKKASENHPIISMSIAEEKLDFPLWFIVNESEFDELMEGLASRNFAVMVRK